MGGGHLGGAHIGGAHLGHSAGIQAGGTHGLADHSRAGGGLGHNPAGAHNLAGGHSFAGRNFAAHGFRNGLGRHGFGGRGFGGRGFGGGFNGYGYGGWAGPVFWPYAYDNMFGYVFSPWDYYDPFWGYGAGDVFASMFWPFAGQSYADDGLAYSDFGLPFTYGDVYGPGYARTRVARADRSARHRPVTDAGSQTVADVAHMCGDRAENLTGLPIDQIDQTVQPTTDQRADLEAVKAASAKANEILAASCPSQVPMTPPGRLAAVENRLGAMRQAVETVRKPLEIFYGSLSDEQKARFNAMREESGEQARRGRTHARQAFASSTDVCRAQAPDSAALPEHEIEQTIHPTEVQRAALDQLRAASAKGTDELKDSCPAQMPLTPIGRITAVETRLDAMLRAVRTERPAMDKFYNSLSDEQKARFNTLRPSSGHQG